MIKNISVLGSTGSIGVNTLNVVRQFPDRFNVRALGAGRNIELLKEQALEFRPKIVSVADQQLRKALLPQLEPEGIQVLCGQEGLAEVATYSDVQIVLSALVGAQGFLPTLKAISAGKDIALANKETLVVAGPIIADEVARTGVRLLPVDSEHSAIWQCLQGAGKETVRKLVLTASGGPFLQRDRSSFDSITISQALDHPNWRMGKKITIDSATLMNKGLEMIEAHYLFDEPIEKLDVIIHPQSIIHSMVEFVDGSVIAQLGISDMRMPIQLALTHPERWENDLPSINLTEIGRLEFFEPDLHKFPCLKLAQEALKTGGSMTAVLNAANEIAVESFLDDRIPFTSIPHVVEGTMEQHHPKSHPTLDDVLKADEWARDCAQKIVSSIQQN